jgi:general stress protein 26
MRSKLRILASALLGVACVAPLAAQERPTEPGTDRAGLLKAAREVMAAARYCTLITLGGDAHPQARIVDPFEPEADMTVWIATNPATRKVAEVRLDPRVTLLYFDSKGPAYVTLLGRANVVDDPAEKAKRWKEEWAQFYRDRNRGADYVLIRVTPRRLEIVSYPHGILNDPANWRPRSLDFALEGGK